MLATPQSYIITMRFCDLTLTTLCFFFKIHQRQQLFGCVGETFRCVLMFAFGSVASNGQIVSTNNIESTKFLLDVGGDNVEKTIVFMLIIYNL